MVVFTKLNIRLATLIVSWYAASTCQNLLSKSTLKKFPHPLTLTLSQYAAIAFTVPLLMTVWGKRRRSFTRRHYMNGLLQLCCLKLFSSLSSFFTLLEVPISYAHTVKAMMPLFTITLSRVILGASYSTKTYITLLPIVLGVILTSATQLEFNAVGLATAMVSTALASMQSIYSKKVMKGIDHLNILVGTSQLLLVVFAPIWFMYEGRQMMFGNGLDHLSYLEAGDIFFWLLMASICNCAQTIIAFTFLSLVQPVTYSVANVSKRIVVISVAILSEALTTGVLPSFLNLMGMAMAAFGVAAYNKVKIDENRENQKKVALPTSMPRLRGREDV